MKKFLIQAVLLLLLIGAALVFYKTSAQISSLPFLPQGPVFKQIRINDAILKVEVADTQEKRSKGLGGRQSLVSDEGMLFIFPKADKHPFWMKGLTYSLDFVWIRGETVVDLLPNIQPLSPGQTDESLPIYQSKEDADKVLEISVGTIQRLNIKVGNKIKII